MFGLHADGTVIQNAYPLDPLSGFLFVFVKGPHLAVLRVTLRRLREL